MSSVHRTRCEESCWYLIVSFFSLLVVQLSVGNFYSMFETVIYPFLLFLPTTVRRFPLMRGWGDKTNNLSYWRMKLTVNYFFSSFFEPVSLITTRSQTWQMTCPLVRSSPSKWTTFISSFLPREEKHHIINRNETGLICSHYVVPMNVNVSTFCLSKVLFSNSVISFERKSDGESFSRIN